jgi:deoxyribose-phosphate aldolase
MVLNVGKLKSGRSQAVASEIAQVVRAVPGVPVKVILEPNRHLRQRHDLGRLASLIGDWIGAN